MRFTITIFFSTGTYRCNKWKSFYGLSLRSFVRESTGIFLALACSTMEYIFEGVYKYFLYWPIFATMRGALTSYLDNHWVPQFHIMKGYHNILFWPHTFATRRGTYTGFPKKMRVWIFEGPDYLLTLEPQQSRIFLMFSPELQAPLNY